MNATRILFICLVLLAALLPAAKPAQAAESYDNCTGFITSLPATIGTQGTWCLNQNLATSVTSGNAITIATNNVTIDCNDFKIGGLAAGDASSAYGIRAYSRQNITVRNCNVRGFQWGIAITSGAGHLIEDNRLDNNLVRGISVTGEHSLVRRNRVFDTGGFGYPGTNNAVAIVAVGDVIDNTVDGVFAIGTATTPSGIALNGEGSVARGNRIRGLVVNGSGYATGITGMDPNLRLVDNSIIGQAGTVTVGAGIRKWAGNSGTIFCSDNTIIGFATPMDDCTNDGGNVVH